MLCMLNPVTTTYTQEHEALADRTFAAGATNPHNWQGTEEEQARSMAFDLYLENVRELDSFEIYRDDTVEQLRQAALDFSNDCWGDFL